MTTGMIRVWYTAIFVVVFFGATVATTTAGLVNVRLDTIVVLHSGAQTNDYIKNELIKKLREHYDFGEQRTRLAILANSLSDATHNNWRVFMNLTGEPNETVVQTIGSEPNNMDLVVPITMIRENMIWKAPTVVIFVSAPTPSRHHRGICALSGSPGRSAVLIELERLMFMGPKLYVVAECIANNERDDLNAYMGNLITLIAEDSANFNFSSLIHRLKRDTDEQLCVYDESCFYVDAQRKCASQWFTPMVSDESGDCSGIVERPSESTISCEQNDCDRTCDDSWPWDGEVRSCNETCGRIALKRKGEYGWKGLQFCSLSYSSDCDPCPTTTPTVSRSGSASIGPQASDASQKDRTTRNAVQDRVTNNDTASEFKPWVVAAAIGAVLGAYFLTRSRKRRGSLLSRYGQAVADSETSTTVTKRTEMTSLSERVTTTKRSPPKKETTTTSRSLPKKETVSVRSALDGQSSHHYSVVRPMGIDSPSSMTEVSRVTQKGKTKRAEPSSKLNGKGKKM